MSNQIEVISPVHFKLSVRGNDMTLRKNNNSEWEVTTINAAVRAYNRGFAMPKVFDSLEAVEAKYNSWRGISALANDLELVADIDISTLN